ncbi:MAG: nitrogen fixation protein FixH [Methylophilaceae bacterium]|nr:MAG: nitrogen fixation protein FixH [Methylophilaceae bacterium]
MENEEIKPWWKFGYAWMVVSGPLAVVIASFVTLYFAMSYPDPVVEEYYAKGINKNIASQGDALAPANKARNHAATGVQRPAN